jgi:hypothetical protein
MEDSDSSLGHAIELDPSVFPSIKPAPERVLYSCKEYTRRCDTRAAETPSVI